MRILLSFKKNWTGVAFLGLNLLLVWLLVGGVVAFYPHLPSEIPLFYSHRWGSAQLVPKYGAVLIPFFGVVIFALTAFFLGVLRRAREEALRIGLVIVEVLVQLSFLYALARIVLNTAVSYRMTLSARLFFAGSLAFLVALLAAFLIRRLAPKVGAVDDSRKHEHPAILHRGIVPRAGAVAFVFSLLFVSLIFLPPTKKLLGIYAGAMVMAIVGVMDDRAASGEGRNLNPYIRLAVQVLAASLVVGAGVGIAFFRNPFNGVVQLDFIDIPIYLYGEHHILLLADIAALLWIVWVMNMLSWSNGVDGQFSGVVFVTFLVLCLLSMRNIGTSSAELYPAMLSAVGAGASLGLLPSTKHPARLMWGFGATACGLVIAAVSVLARAKVAAALLVLLVPALDAVVAVVRRLSRGQSPVWGDSEHLHHHLLRLGLSQGQVAALYWVFTLCGGFLALYAAEKGSVLTVLMAVGAVLWALVVLNLGRGSLGRHLQREGDHTQENGGDLR